MWIYGNAEMWQWWGKIGISIENLRHENWLLPSFPPSSSFLSLQSKGHRHHRSRRRSLTSWRPIRFAFPSWSSVAFTKCADPHINYHCWTPYTLLLPSPELLLFLMQQHTCSFLVMERKETAATASVVVRSESSDGNSNSWWWCFARTHPPPQTLN